MTINNSSNIKNKNINKTLDILEGNLNENISEVSKENRNVFSFDKVKTNEDKELLCKLYRLFGNEDPKFGKELFEFLTKSYIPLFFTIAYHKKSNSIYFKVCKTF